MYLNYKSNQVTLNILRENGVVCTDIVDFIITASKGVPTSLKVESIQETLDALENYSNWELADDVYALLIEERSVVSEFEYDSTAVISDAIDAEDPLYWFWDYLRRTNCCGFYIEIFEDGKLIGTTSRRANSTIPTTLFNRGYDYTLKATTTRRIGNNNLDVRVLDKKGVREYRLIPSSFCEITGFVIHPDHLEDAKGYARIASVLHPEDLFYTLSETGAQELLDEYYKENKRDVKFKSYELVQESHADIERLLEVDERCWQNEVH